MKLPSTSLLALFGLSLFNGVTGVGISDLPNCAHPCVTQLLSSHVCGPTDVECICSNKTLISNVSCCIFKNCKGSAINKNTLNATHSSLTGDNPASEASSVADKICALAGVTTLPQQASCPSTAGPSGASSTTPPAAMSTSSSSPNGGVRPTGVPGVGAMGAVGGAALGLAGLLI